MRQTDAGQVRLTAAASNQPSVDQGGIHGVEAPDTAIYGPSGWIPGFPSQGWGTRGILYQALAGRLPGIGVGAWPGNRAVPVVSGTPAARQQSTDRPRSTLANNSITEVLLSATPAAGEAWVARVMNEFAGSLVGSGLCQIRHAIAGRADVLPHRARS